MHDHSALAAAFAPHDALAAAVLVRWQGSLADDDGSHDRSHLMRVWRIVLRIADEEPLADTEVLAVATLLHDCVAVEKNHSDRAMASRLSADAARKLLVELPWPDERIEAAAHAIEAHSFSAGIEPRSLEAAILRDADRLDSLGALGVARTFYVAGRMRSRLYHLDDPLGKTRDLDDRTFALDHFETKLFKLENGLLTSAGKRIGQARIAFMRSFVAELGHEIAST